MMHIFDTLFFESVIDRRVRTRVGAHFFDFFSNPSDSTRVRTRVGTHVFRIPSNSARGTATDLRSTSIQTGDACMGLAYAPIWACI